MSKLKGVTIEGNQAKVEAFEKKHTTYETNIDCDSEREVEQIEKAAKKAGLKTVRLYGDPIITEE